MRRTPPPSPRAVRAGSAFLLALACAACVTTPKPAEVLACGFRSPEQCFRTFQVAVRADEPALEYRCFSNRFRAANHVSQLTWREAREELWGRIGMRWAVGKAEPDGPALVRGDRAELSVSALGRRVDLRFVREDFGELWGEDGRLFDDELDFRRQSGVQPGDGGKRWFYAQLPLPQGAEAGAVTEIRLGREWKLDDIAFSDDG